MGKSFLMEYYELLFNIEAPNKFGKDNLGCLHSDKLNLHYVADGHSKYPQSCILIDKFQEYISSINTEFQKLNAIESEIVSFLKTVITNFHSKYHKMFLPGAMSIIIAVFSENRIITAHLGDCRLGVLSNDDKLTWLTMPHNISMLGIDHTLDIEMQLKKCEFNHIVTRSLNTKSLKKIECNIFDANHGLYLLASDGVWKLQDSSILKLIHLKEKYFSTHLDIEDDIALALIPSYQK